MSQTADEALKSDDSELIKKTRGAFKEILTRVSITLISELRRDDSGKLFFEEIHKNDNDTLISKFQQVKGLVDE